MRSPLELASVGAQTAQPATVKTRHDADLCRMAFGQPRPATGCPRCIELANGAEPRKGYGRSAKQRRKDDAERTRQIKAHNCRQSGCGPVCTAFDW